MVHSFFLYGLLWVQCLLSSKPIKLYIFENIDPLKNEADKVDEVDESLNTRKIHTSLRESSFQSDISKKGDLSQTDMSKYYIQI